jgi:tRNA(Met) C34 N-acetyltransferase TmcA
MSQQFGDGNFAQLSGARIVRVAVHPEVQGLGYGSRAMELLYRYYNGEMVNLSGGDGNVSDSEEEGESSSDETPSESEDEQPAAKNALIHKESLKPRKKLVSQTEFSIETTPKSLIAFIFCLCLASTSATTLSTPYPTSRLDWHIIWAYTPSSQLLAT